MALELELEQDKHLKIEFNLHQILFTQDSLIAKIRHQCEIRNRTLASLTETDIVCVLQIKAIISEETSERIKKTATMSQMTNWKNATSFHLNRQLIGRSIRIEYCAQLSETLVVPQRKLLFHYFSLCCVPVCVSAVFRLYISFIFSLSHAKITHSVRIICLMLNVARNFDTAQKAECHGELESTDILSLICFHLL